MNIKLVAVDMDGTLLNSKKEMPEEFIPWVKSHPEIKTVIASGRQYYTLERDFLPIRDNLAFIAENGGRRSISSSSYGCRGQRWTCVWWAFKYGLCQCYS